MRYIVKHIRDDRRLQREFGVIDTENDKIMMHTSSSYRAYELAEDLNKEVKIAID